MDQNGEARKYAMRVVNDPNVSDFQRSQALGALVDGLYDEVSANPFTWIPQRHRGKAIGLFLTWAALVTAVMFERLVQIWAVFKETF